VKREGRVYATEAFEEALLTPPSAAYRLLVRASKQHLAHIRRREHVQIGANLRNPLEPVELHCEEIANLLGRRTRGVGQRPDGALRSGGIPVSLATCDHGDILLILRPLGFCRLD
jgi:hypothetical protein